jgi:inorganic triphosphatase YgiF
MAETTIETERKYDLTAAAALPAWSDVAGVGGVVGPHEHLLEATYFDTPEVSLAAAGVTLRRRRGGSDSGWHLKLPVDVESREEIRVRFARGEARRRNPEPPAELVGLVRALSRGQTLTPVAELSTVRRSWRLTDDEGRDLAEVVDDHVTGRTLGSSTETRTWREVEIELAEHGDIALIEQLERHLETAGIHRANDRSKLARLLGRRVPRPPRAPGRRSTCGSVVLAYLHAQARAIRVLDPAVRRQLPDAVHQMRVAIRRMRSTLQAYRAVVPRDATRDLAGELSWLTSTLGAARDLEVQEADLHQAVARLPDELVLARCRHSSPATSPDARPGPTTTWSRRWTATATSRCSPPSRTC